MATLIKSITEEYLYEQIELKDGKVIILTQDDQDGYIRVGVYLDPKRADEGTGVILDTQTVAEKTLVEMGR